MKKTLSRLVCVLLVVAMFCGMVPAVLADPPTSVPGTGTGTKADPYIMYVGDSQLKEIQKPTACSNTNKHTTATPTFALSYGTEGIWDAAATATGYISYNERSRTLTASKPTISTLDGVQGAAFVRYACTGSVTSGTTTSKCGWADDQNAVYAKVYAKATGIALKKQYDNKAEVKTNEDLTLLANQKYMFDYKVLDNGTAWNDKYSTACQSIDVKSTDTNIFTVTKNEATQTLTIQTKAVSAGNQANLIITADQGTSHEKIRVIEIFVTQSSTIEIKNGNTVMARTDDSETRVHYGYIGDKMTLTATDASGYANTNLVDWTSSDHTVAEFTSKNGLTLKTAGETTITAKMGTSSQAQFKLRVIDKTISAVNVKDEKNVEIKNLELDAGSSYKAKATLTPTSAETENAKFVVWTSSDYEVVNFAQVMSSDPFEVDIDTKAVTAAQVSIRGLKAGTATVTAKINGKTDTFTVKVNEVKPSKHIVEVIDDSEYDVRASINDSSVDILTRMATKYKTVPAYYYKSDADKTDGKKTMTTVPVEWTGAIINKTAKTAAVTGQAKDTDGATTYTYEGNNRTLTVTVELTDGVAVTSAVVKANTARTTGGTSVQLTVDATVEPSDADMTYQWYQNGAAISGATGRTASYRIPKDNEAGGGVTEYRFTCVVTANKNGKSGVLESPTPAVVLVDRDYSLQILVDDGQATYTVGELAKATATLYYKNNAVNTSFTWKLITEGGTNVDTDKATIGASGNAATITTKAVGNKDGEKFVIQASANYNGVTVSGEKVITVKPASVGSVKMSVGAGGTLKASSLVNAINTAIGSSDVTPSYLIFGNPSNGSLYINSTSKTNVGSTKCFINATTGQKLSDLYFVGNTNATAGSVAYTVYNAKDGAIAAGSISFDLTAGGTTISSIGTDFEKAGVVDELMPSGSSSAYVTFGNVVGGTLYYNYRSFVSKEAVSSNDRFYFSGTGNKLLKDVYFLPEADVFTATVQCYVNGGDVETITFKTIKQSTSNVFSDVNGSNVGSWASNAVDFMADNGLVGGTGGRNFSPKTNMTRGMLVTVMYRAAGKPSVAGLTMPFTDVPQSQYYYDAVLWAYNKGVVTGNTATTFNPNGNITRQDIAVILYRYAGNPVATGSVTSFSDSKDIANYALTAMQWAVGKNIIGGSNNKLNPKGQATRAEVAVMLYRFLTK